MWSRAVVVGVLMTAAGPATAQVKLDAFPDGFIENLCKGSADFEAFAGSLSRRYGESLDPQARAVIPDPIRSAVGKARVKTQEGWSDVLVPLSGSFAGSRCWA